MVGAGASNPPDGPAAGGGVVARGENGKGATASKDRLMPPSLGGMSDAVGGIQPAGAVATGPAGAAGDVATGA